MMGFLDRVKPEDVKDAKSFANFCQQEIGIPYPTGKQIAILKKSINEFFDTYPNATYFTLVRIVDWAKARRKRYPTAYGLLKSGFRYAWTDGYLPELDPTHEYADENLEDKIDKAIALETHEGWLRRLMVSKGNDARHEVYDAWVSHRGELYGINS